MKFIRLLSLLALTAVVSLSTVACDDDDDGPTTPAVPETPTSVQAVATGQTITVTWSASANADSYTVTLATDGEDDRTQTVPATEASFSDLTPAKTYAATVTATGSGGTSGTSTPAIATTDEEPETFVEVTTDILTNTTWTSDKVYRLNQPIFVGVDCGADGNAAGCVAATLTIEPGTTVVGRTDIPRACAARTSW